MGWDGFNAAYPLDCALDIACCRLHGIQKQRRTGMPRFEFGAQAQHFFPANWRPVGHVLGALLHARLPEGFIGTEAVDGQEPRACALRYALCLSTESRFGENAIQDGTDPQFQLLTCQVQDQAIALRSGTHRECITPQRRLQTIFCKQRDAKIAGQRAGEGGFPAAGQP